MEKQKTGYALAFYLDVTLEREWPLVERHTIIAKNIEFLPTGSVDDWTIKTTIKGSAHGYKKEKVILDDQNKITKVHEEGEFKNDVDFEVVVERPDYLRGVTVNGECMINEEGDISIHELGDPPFEGTKIS